MAIWRRSAASARACIQRLKAAAKARGLMQSKTRSKVSWQGIPSGRVKKRRSQSVVGAADDGTNGDANHVQQQVTRCATRVFEIAEVDLQCQVSHDSPP